MAVPVAKKYIKDFEQLGLGVFVHFGLYSLLGKAEWVADLRPGYISEADYRRLVDKFNPDNMEQM